MTTVEPTAPVDYALGRMRGSVPMFEETEQIFQDVVAAKRAEYLATGMELSQAEYKARLHREVRVAAANGEWYRDRVKTYALTVIAEGVLMVVDILRVAIWGRRRAK